MKRILFISFLLMVGLCSSAQSSFPLPKLQIEGVLLTDYQQIEKGTPALIYNFTSKKSMDSYGNDKRSSVYMVEAGKKKFYLPFDSASFIVEIPSFNVEDFWINEFVNHKMPKYYRKKGYNLSVRRELMDDANDYLNDMSKLLYADEYMQDYILTIFNSIIPRHLDNKRPEQLVVEILKSPNPDAHMLPNGTLLLTTGLLSVLDSTEELIAIMVSEVAHYVLDHQVVNLVKERTKLRRAAIWSASLQLIASGVDLALTIDRKENYIPGSIVADVGVVTHEIISLAIGHFGMGYSDQQFYDADDIALRFLIRRGMDPSSLGSALRKIEMYYIEAKDETVFTQEGGYANINYRIGRLGYPVLNRNFDYLKKMSVVTTANALMQLNGKNYWAAEKLAQKNIDNQLAVSDDYFVLIKANMSYASNPEDNERNLKRIRKIKESTSSTHLGLSKLEILLLLRLEQKEEAMNALGIYLDQVSDFKQQSFSEFDVHWANQEMSWGNGLYRQL